jgi:hypothetical protein
MGLNLWRNKGWIRFDAFPASEYNEVFSGYQPGKVVQFCTDQRFEDHISVLVLRVDEFN